MAARRTGGLELDRNIELTKTVPLDARQLVRSKEELLDPASFLYGYNGMIVAERTEGKLYMLMDKDNPTVEASWKDITGGGGSGGPVDWSDVQNKPTFATVATSGSYNDLSDQPTIPEAYDDTALAARVTAVENGKANIADLAPVATSGSYNDLGDKPTIPEAYDDTEVRGLIAAKANSADLAPVATSGSYNDLGDKPTIPEAYDDTEVRGLIAAKANSADLATVATSGSYNDLGDKPTIPEAYDDTALAARVTAVEADLGGLATVASSGSYNDLSDKPTIPAEVTVDAAMSDTSENPVQNKVVLAAITDAVDVVEANVYTKTETDALLDAKQDTLESGTNIKTINNQPLLGSGNIQIEGGGGSAATLQEMFNGGGNNALVIESDNRASEAEPALVIRNNWYGQPTSDWSTSGIHFSASEGEGRAIYGRGEIFLENGEGSGFSISPSTVDMSTELTDAFKAALDIEETFTQAEKSKLEGLSNYDDTALSERVTANAMAIANSYTKTETDGKIAEAMTDVDNEHFHPVTALPDPADEDTTKRPKENHEYILIEYEQDGVTIKSKKFYLFYDGAYHEDRAAGVSLDGYATEQYVDDGLATKQDTLVSGTNVKTVNGESLLGAGNVVAGINIEVGKERWQGTYTDENGETFQVYSKMVYIPALPATAGITTYDHGVANIKQILNIYGFTTDGFVLNAPRQNAQDNIAIYQASKNASNQTFSIEVGKDRSNKAAYVVMVYAKNN